MFDYHPPQKQSQQSNDNMTFREGPAKETGRTSAARVAEIGHGAGAGVNDTQ